MKASRLSLALIAAAVALGSAAAPAADERVVERQRVVVRVDVDAAGGEYDYVFVDHEDGEPIILDSVVTDRGYLGVTLLDLTPELRRHFGAPAAAGVMISGVEPESPAARAGLRAGDVLIAIEGRDVGSATEVLRRVFEGEAGQILELHLRRDGESRTVSATLAARKRMQLDLGGLVRVPGRRGGAWSLDLGRQPVPLVEFDAETMGRALSLMREHFDGQEWRDQVERLGGDREGLEKRIRELERRLRELERQLGELPE